MSFEHIYIAHAHTSKQSLYIPEMEGIKHAPSLICEPGELVHTHSITNGESRINPAACFIVSAVTSQACSLLYSANMYKESCVEVLCFYKHKVKQSEGEHDLLDMIPQTSTLSLYWCLCGSFHFFLELKTLQK